MKRLYVLFLSLFLVVACFAQNNDKSRVQDEFLNCQFYFEKFTVKQILNKQGLDYSDEINEIDLYDIKFGGYTWKFCHIYFDYLGRFFAIEFSYNCVTLKESLALFDDLQHSLKKRYKEGVLSAPYNNEEGCWFRWDDEERAIRLSCKKSESKGGKIYYYVTLSYWDIELGKKQSQKENDEL